MGGDTVEIRVHIRRVIVISVKRLYRSICNHPFLFGFLCFLILLYRSFPSVFSLLVSASPVIVCTAALLGTLLSFGQPNIPEIEKEEKVTTTTTHEVDSLKTGLLEDSTVVERGGLADFATVDRFIEKRRDIVLGSTDEANLVERRASEVEEDVGLFEYMPLIDENSSEIKFEERRIDVAERELNDSELEKTSEIRKEKPEVEGKLNDEEVENLLNGNKNLEGEDNKSKGDFVHADREDKLSSDIGSSWKWLGEDSDGENGEDDDKSYDSESDGAESSSPDASMADILPMLDELHPLLDLGAPQPAQTLHDGSDAASVRSHKSDDEFEEDNDDDDDEEEEEEEEEAKGEKDDESKSAIKWTEVDQRNLMDLGTSELERNQRLENLIARRRARKNMRLMAEKNLIDLEGSDLSFNIPPIATTRRNPFELPYDSYDDMAIPGSAPSILLPRRNPFDLPYDANEEKPDLKGDSFQQEFTASQSREPVFRRNETFTMGPSVLGGPRLERQDFRWRPYFVPERFSSDEGTSYPSFQRQLSEISESKASSVPDTESVSSAVDEEDKKQSPVQVASEGPSHSAPLQRQTSEISESKASSVIDTESLSSAVDEEDNKLRKQDVPQETEVISGIDHVADLVEQRSIYSNDLESVDGQDIHRYEDEVILGGIEDPHEMESSLSESGGQTTPQELNAASEIHLPIERVEEGYSSRSSLSSLSELEAKIPNMKSDGSRSLEQEDDHIGESGISARSSVDELEFQSTRRVVEPKNPVYDSSPPGLEKFLSFTSISSDTQLELSEMGSPPDKESEVHVENKEKDASESGKMNENQSTVDEITIREKSNEHDLEKVGPSSACPSFDVRRGLTASLFSLDTGSLEDYTVYRGEIFHPERGELTSSHDSKIDSADSTSSAPEGQQNTRLIEHDSLHPSVSSPKAESTEQARVKEQKVQLEQGDVQLPTSSDKADSIQEQSSVKEETRLEENQVQPSSMEENKEVFSGDSTDKNVLSEEKSLSKLDKQPSGTDKSITEPCYDDLDEPKEVPALLKQALQAVNTTSDANESGAHDKAKVLENSLSTASGSTSTPFQSPEYGSPGAEITRDETLEGVVYEDCIEEESFSYSVEAQEVKEIDEGLLSELDTVGDFSVKEAGAESSPSDSKTKEINPEIPVIEAKSVQDIELTFKQLHEGADIEEIILPSMLEDHVAADGFKTPDGSDTGLPVVEATSMDDIHAVMKQVSEGHAGELPESSESKKILAVVQENKVSAQKIKPSTGVVPDVKVKSESLAGGTEGVSENKQVSEGNSGELSEMSEMTNHSAEVKENEVASIQQVIEAREINPKIPFIEAKSIQDIELTFKQLHEGAEVEEIILPSMLEDHTAADGFKTPVGSDSGLPVVEARSMQDIPEGHAGELPESLESNKILADVQENQASAEKIKPSIVAEPGVKVKSESLAGETEGVPGNKQVSEGNTDEISDKSELTNHTAAGKENEAVSIQQVVEMKEVNPEIPVIEAKTIEDIELTFKQLHEGAEVEEIILPSMLQDHVSADGSKTPLGSDSGLPAVEARSVEDIHAVMKQVSEGPGQLPELPESKKILADVQEEEVSAQQFKPSSDVEPGEKVKNESLAGETEGVSEDKQVSESNTGELPDKLTNHSAEGKENEVASIQPVKSSSAAEPTVKESSGAMDDDMKRVSEKTLEDGQVLEVSPAEPSKPSDSKEQSAEVKENDMVSGQLAESSIKA